MKYCTVWGFNMDSLRAGLFLRWSWWLFKGDQDHKRSLKKGTGIKTTLQ